MNIIRASLRLSGSQGLTSILNFLALIFFARELGPHALGVYFLFQSVSALVKLTSNLGLTPAMEKRISEQQAQSEIFASGIILRGLFLLPFLLGIALFQNQINAYIGAEIALLLIVAILIDAAGQLLVFVLKGELRVGETAELQVVQQLGWVVFGIVLVLVGFEVLALVYGAIAGSFLKTVWGMYKVSIPLGTVSVTQMKDLLSVGKFFFLPVMDSYLYNWLDIIIIGFFLGQEAVGAYEIAWRVAGILVIFSKALANALFPQVSSWEVRTNGNQIVSVLPNALTASYLLVIPGCFGILVLSREILEIVFGAEYVFAWTVLIILAVGKTFEATYHVVGPILRGIGRADLSTVAVAISGGLNIILNIILVLQIGLIGAAIATTMTVLIRSLMHYYYLFDFHPFAFPAKRVAWITISAAIMAISVVLLQQYLPVDSVLHLAMVAGVGSFIYFTLVIFSPSIRYKIVDNLSKIYST